MSIILFASFLPNFSQRNNILTKIYKLVESMTSKLCILHVYTNLSFSFQHRDDVEDENKRLNKLTRMLNCNGGRHIRMFLFLIFCQLLCILFTVGIFFTLDCYLILDGKFLDYGFRYFDTENLLIDHLNETRTSVLQVIPDEARQRLITKICDMLKCLNRHRSKSI